MIRTVSAVTRSSVPVLTSREHCGLDRRRVSPRSTSPEHTCHATLVVRREMFTPSLWIRKSRPGCYGLAPVTDCTCTISQARLLFATETTLGIHTGLRTTTCGRCIVTGKGDSGVGMMGGIARFDCSTRRFTSYQGGLWTNTWGYVNKAWTICEDNTGTMGWFPIGDR